TASLGRSSWNLRRRSLVTKHRSLVAALASAAMVFALAACGSSGSSSSSSSASSSGPVTGAGSTFIAPMMSKWQADYSAKTGHTVTYGAIGSGGGVEQITNRTVELGGSDAPRPRRRLTAGQ